MTRYIEKKRESSTCMIQKDKEETLEKTHLMKSRNQLQRKAFVTATFPTKTKEVGICVQ